MTDTAFKGKSTNAQYGFGKIRADSCNLRLFFSIVLHIGQDKQH